MGSTLGDAGGVALSDPLHALTTHTTSVLSPAISGFTRRPLPCPSSPFPSPQLDTLPLPWLTERSYSCFQSYAAMSALGSEWISDRSREGSATGCDSPEGNHGPSQQRTSKKRKVLSCYACRDRKLKCDRVFPVCGRCQKTGRRNECTYDPRLLEESHVSAQADGGAPCILAQRPADSNGPTDTPDALRGKIGAQEKRIAMLEQQLALQRTRNSSQYTDVVLEEPTLGEDIMFRGKGFKSIFNGPTSIMGIISSVPLTRHELCRCFA